MKIDARVSLTAKTVREIDAADAAMMDSMDHEGRTDRTARRRYYRLIRRVSGLPWVTCHSVEHSGEFHPEYQIVAFGR